MESDRSTATTTVPEREGSSIDNPAIASTISVMIVDRRIVSSREGIGQMNSVAANGIASSSQIGWVSVIMPGHLPGWTG